MLPDKYLLIKQNSFTYKPGQRHAEIYYLLPTADRHLAAAMAPGTKREKALPGFVPLYRRPLQYPRFFRPAPYHTGNGFFI
jgi:hypothetical protein